jgi:Protein of Unknown function (DUF2784)
MALRLPSNVMGQAFSSPARESAQHQRTPAVYVFLDMFFLVFHATLIGFNLTGWLWERTRRLHLVVLTLTFCSWGGLGLFYGLGYCPCTDWHWQVKRARGEIDLPTSYIKYYLDFLTGLNWPPLLVDMLTLGLGITALGLSVGLNWRRSRGPSGPSRAPVLRV